MCVCVCEDRKREVEVGRRRETGREDTGVRDVMY